MTYLEKLQDPRWKLKRDEIVSEAGGKCEDCGVSGELHVHHCIYIKDREPWEYTRNVLIAVCPHCHRIRQELEGLIRQWIACFLRFSTQELVFRVEQMLREIAKSHANYIREEDDNG